MSSSVTVVSQFYCTRHEFSPFEWAINPIKQLLVTSKEKVTLLHYCRCLASIGFTIGKDYQLFLSHGSLYNTFRFYQIFSSEKDSSSDTTWFLLSSVSKVYGISRNRALPSKSILWANQEKQPLDDPVLKSLGLSWSAIHKQVFMTVTGVLLKGAWLS